MIRAAYLAICRAYLRWSIASDTDYLQICRREGFSTDEPAFRSRIEAARVRLALME